MTWMSDLLSRSQKIDFLSQSESRISCWWVRSEIGFNCKHTFDPLYIQIASPTPTCPPKPPHPHLPTYANLTVGKLEKLRALKLDQKKSGPSEHYYNTTDTDSLIWFRQMKWDSQNSLGNQRQSCIECLSQNQKGNDLQQTYFQFELEYFISIVVSVVRKGEDNVLFTNKSV